MNCIVCSKVFESKRADAQYCSGACRAKAQREDKRTRTVEDKRTDIKRTREDVTDKPNNYGQDNCECRHCQNIRTSGKKLTLNHTGYKTAGQLKPREINRVSLPGDMDYNGAMV